ncbi:YkgB protein [Aaosphaeria arxii CBS 175.79]|uniref:YkgB protein n=1 Tax=Aaosphaeria arxii CBS 175.79 TaxID=1450172 RepID=A0A6A5Y8N0_9PLEO|nr:YkgB protein [Aaosphaeria arxii CBS 175.79]KAF2021925.1 YkgB protein [Aaosphaeria arxii CBS 175.79]
MALSKLLIASLATSASAVKLWVSSYAPEGSTVGAVSTLEFTPGVGGGSLKTLSENKECGSAPTWLDLAIGGSRIVCTNEGWQDAAATLNTLLINSDGSLTKSSTTNLPFQGPVSTQFFNNNGAVAVAHYGGSAITNLKVNANGSFSVLQEFNFAGQPTGPKPQQEAPHVHHSVIDPTGKFIVFPDLGSDLIRIYGIDSSSKLTEQKSFVTAPGYGPRHAAFWQPKTRNYGKKAPTYLFVINELVNKVTSYQVSYANSTLTLNQIQEQSSFGPNQATPAGAAGGEISVSPDNRFVTVSNRKAPVFKVKNPNPSNSTQIDSDSLLVLKPSDDGKLSFVQLAPSGGLTPRHFAVNKAGNLIAVGNQDSASVEIFARSAESGKIGAQIATLQKIFGSPNNIVWDEK